MAAQGTKRVTKSVRFSPEESSLIEQVSRREHLPEGTLLRKLALDGLARYRLDHAIRDYESGELNLGEAARRASVSVQHMMTELERRGIGIGGEAHFIAGLENLTEMFGGSEALRETIADLKARRRGTGPGDQ